MADTLTENLPAWVLNPADPNAAAAMAADLATAVARQKLEGILEEHPDADPGDVTATMRFRSEVAFEAIHLTGQVQALADRSLNEQAVVAIREQLHLHHPNEYESAQQYFQDALADTSRSLSEASDLRFYAETVVPHMREQGITGAEKLWVKGENVKKARVAKPALNKAFRELERARKKGDEKAVEKAEQVIGKILHDVSDSSVTADGLAAKRHGSEMPPDMDHMAGIKYLQGQGTVMILVAISEAQRLFVEQALGEFAEWHLGDGHEGILAVLPKFIPPQRD